MWNSMVEHSILSSTEWFWKVVGTLPCILECTAGNEKDHNLEEPPHFSASDILARNDSTWEADR